MNRPIPRRPLPKRKGRHLRGVGDIATIGGVVLIVAFWFVAAVMPLILMGAAAHWLITH